MPNPVSSTALCWGPNSGRALFAGARTGATVPGEHTGMSIGRRCVARNDRAWPIRFRERRAGLRHIIFGICNFKLKIYFVDGKICDDILSTTSD